MPPINLASSADGGVAGILGAANGGSGVNAPTAHGILIGEGSSAFSPLVGVDACIFTGKGASADPVCVTASGDLGYTDTGAFTLNKIQGTSISAPTGTGAVVLANGPTLTNPIVGTQISTDNSTKAASTAYVTAAVAAATTGVSSFNGRSGAVAPAAGDYATNQLTTSVSGSNPAAGKLGYTISASVGVTALTSSVQDLATLSVPAGDWRCWGSADMQGGAGAPRTIIVFLSTVATTDPGFPNGGAYYYLNAAAQVVNSETKAPIGEIVLHLSTTTNLYFEAYANTASTQAVGGFEACSVID
jgi:hypothetical protein